MKRALAATRIAWRRGEEQLAELDRQWADAGAVCCPGCMFGARWLDLTRKQERRLRFIDHAMAYVAKHQPKGTP